MREKVRLKNDELEKYLDFPRENNTLRADLAKNLEILKGQKKHFEMFKLERNNLKREKNDLIRKLMKKKSSR